MSTDIFVYFSQTDVSNKFQKKPPQDFHFRKYCGGGRSLNLFLQRKDNLFRKELALILHDRDPEHPALTFSLRLIAVSLFLLKHTFL